MSVTLESTAQTLTAGQTVPLSSLVQVSAGGTNPAYLILNAYDRDEYTAASSHATGVIQGSGAQLALTSDGGGDDAREADIVFTYDAASGRYLNATYGDLSQLTYTAPAAANDVTVLSLFGASTAARAGLSSGGLSNLVDRGSLTYIGGATLVVDPEVVSPAATAQATPSSIAAVAQSFVGAAWNTNGCWTLASTIATEAGAGLPATSTFVGAAGQPGGEWIVAFNGPAGQTGDWQSMVKPGEMIAFLTSPTDGHITTCVSGAGAAALVVDNITYETAAGAIINLANDGSPDDVTIAKPHAASQEFSGVKASAVVIYELDTPIVTAAAAVAAGAVEALGALFSATDPAGKAVTQYQIYDAGSAASLVVSGVAYAAGAVATTTSLAFADLVGGAGGSETVYVRGYNGAYWGDWTSEAVPVTQALVQAGGASVSASASALAADYTALTFVDLSLAPTADQAAVAGLAAQVQAGSATLAQAVAQLAPLAAGTTSVAETTYAFFTGLTPSEAGLEYLIGSPSSATGLAGSYYQGFSTENRYINFAVNLGKVGEGAAAFSATYGALSVADTATAAYTAIFGTAPSAAQVSSFLNDSVPNGLGGTETRLAYLAGYGGDGQAGLGTKAALVGWLLSQAVSSGVGAYATADAHFLQELASGSATFHVNLVGAYGS